MKTLDALRVFFQVVLLLGSSEIFARSCVDLDPLAFIDEDRDLDNCACLNCSSLCNVCSCISLYARLCLDYFEVYKVRSFNSECIVLVEFYCSDVILADILDGILNKFICKRNLIVSLLIHEVVEFSVIERYCICFVSI